MEDVAKNWAAGQSGVEEFAEVRRELEPEPTLDCDHLGFGQNGVECTRLDGEWGEIYSTRSSVQQ